MSCSQYGWYNPLRWACSGLSGIAEATVVGTSSGLSSGAGQGINSAVQEFFKNIDWKGNGDLAGKGIGETIRSFNGPVFKEVFSLAREVSAEAAAVAGEAIKSMTLNTLPWTVLGLVAVTGMPLLVKYGYEKAKHNIGKPQLASETRYVGFWDRFTNGVVQLGSVSFQAAKAGYWGGFTGLGAGTLLSVGAAMYQEYGGPWAEAMGLISCPAPSALADSWLSSTKLINKCSPLSYATEMWLKSLMPLKIPSYFAMAAAGYKVCSLAWQHFQKPAGSKPIFSAELEAKIAGITKATYNLKKNGGYFQNILLYGPGGTGKTMVAQMIARGSNMNYVMMSGGDLAQYIKRGEHVTELNRLFASIKNSRTPTILFIDEVESLAKDRSHIDKQELFELLNAFLSHTGKESKKFMIIAATNRPQDLDEAFLSRMDHKIEIAPPAQAEREKILKQYIPEFFKAKEMEQFFSPEAIAKIASATAGLTGRSLFKMVNAIFCQKAASDNNALTQEMIHSTVKGFVEQEKRLQALQNPKAAQSCDASAQTEREVSRS